MSTPLATRTRTLILRQPKISLRESPLPSHIRPYIALPRELKYLIITYLIHKYDHDPVHQWTNMRLITWYHRTHLESYFLHFWLPKLILTVYGREDTIVEYRLFSVDKKTKTIAKFRAREGWKELREEEREVWGDGLWRANLPSERYPKIILRLGVGEERLNRGFGGAWILSDTEISDLKADEGGRHVWFDWKKLFNAVFREECLMRRVSEKWIQEEVARLKKSKLWPIYPPKQRVLIVQYLRTKVCLRRRAILSAYRAHLARHGDPPFLIPIEEKLHRISITPFRDSIFAAAAPPTIFEIAYSETSIIFSMPRWQHLGLREIARLRVEELRWRFDGWGEKWYRRDCEPTNEVLLGWAGKQEVSEEDLERQLKHCRFLLDEVGNIDMQFLPGHWRLGG